MVPFTLSTTLNTVHVMFRRSKFLMLSRSLVSFCQFVRDQLLNNIKNKKSKFNPGLIMSRYFITDSSDIPFLQAEVKTPDLQAVVSLSR